MPGPVTQSDAAVEPGIDGGGAPPIDGGSGPIDGVDAGDDPIDGAMPDAWMPGPLYPHATIGTRCSGGAVQEFLVLSSERASCETHAEAFAGDDPARFVAVRVTGTSFTASATMCGEGTCGPAQLSVSLSGTTGSWSATVAGLPRTGTIAATRCDYDAFFPPAAESPVDDLALREVALYQGVKITLARDGSAVAPSAPIVAGREALIRLFVEPRPEWVQREVVARLEIGSGAPIEVRGTVARASTDADLASTLNLRVPADRIEPNVPIAVGIYDVASECGGGSGTTGGARFPAAGTATLAARSTGGPFRVVLVPVQYDGDGSGRLPDTGDENLRRYQELIHNLYPVEEVEITVRDAPLVWDRRIGADGSGWSALLNECMNLRQRDAPPSDTYYYCLFSPASSFGAFCSGGCVAGLGPVPGARDTFSRASIGLGYRGTEGTFVHEVGHSLGRPHAPCGGVDGAEQAYPYSGGRIGSWGYDLANNQLRSPATYTDMMGYCDPVWISDYNYTKLFDRIRAVRGVAAVVGAPTRYATVIVEVDGSLSWGGEVELALPPSGDPITARWGDGAGGETVVDGVLMPVSHVTGGIVYVPLPPVPASSVTIDGLGTLPLR